MAKTRMTYYNLIDRYIKKREQATKKIMPAMRRVERSVYSLRQIQDDINKYTRMMAQASQAIDAGLVYPELKPKAPKGRRKIEL